jgi:ectoine hydroxylase-related dioxygenase (phytanoyl-CoA dioxygenase family)
MPKVLNDEAVAQYKRDGYYYPTKILHDEEVATNRARLEDFETSQGRPISGALRNKSHLLFTWVDKLMRHPKILDTVEDLIGADILCWNTFFWVKEPGSESFVSWHQDLRYWGLDNSDLVTVWLALSPATLESGCMRVLPGSHRDDLLPHQDAYEMNNLLTRGQEISVEVDEAKAVAMPLRPGEISLHNVQLAHASGPNRSDDRRIGLSLHYMPTCTKQVVGEWDSAALVRGEDRYGHFTPAPSPSKDLDPAAVAFHEKATQAVRDVLFKDAAKVRQTL